MTKVTLKAVLLSMLCTVSLGNAQSMHFYGGMINPREEIAKIAGVKTAPVHITNNVKTSSQNTEKGDADIKDDGKEPVIPNVISYIEKKPLNQISGISQKEAAMRIKLYREIQKHLGKPYYWGASGRSRFDCSSLMQAVYKDSLNVNIPRVSREQGAKLGHIVPLAKMRMGDLIFMDTLHKGYITHVGMYVGNGEMIHASSTYGKVVRVKFDGFYRNTYRFSRTLFG